MAEFEISSTRSFSRSKIIKVFHWSVIKFMLWLTATIFEARRIFWSSFRFFVLIATTCSSILQLCQFDRCFDKQLQVYTSTEVVKDDLQANILFECENLLMKTYRSICLFLFFITHCKLILRFNTIMIISGQIFLLNCDDMFKQF
jgi:hypothetical protein